jgi:hypothetical protein
MNYWGYADLSAIEKNGIRGPILGISEDATNALKAAESKPAESVRQGAPDMKLPAKAGVHSFVGTVLETRAKSWACANLDDAQRLYLLSWLKGSLSVGAYNAALTPGCVFFDPGQSLIIADAKGLSPPFLIADPKGPRVGFTYICVRPTGSNQACLWQGLVPEDEIKIGRSVVPCKDAIDPTLTRGGHAMGVPSNGRTCGTVAP